MGVKKFKGDRTRPVSKFLEPFGILSSMIFSPSAMLAGRELSNGLDRSIVHKMYGSTDNSRSYQKNRFRYPSTNV